MLNKIIRFSLQFRLVVLLLAGLILVGGCIALVRSEVDIFPDLNAPTVVVMTEAPGLAPEEVERLVTYPIETAVNGATGVRRVRSSSASGFSVVWVEFDWDSEVYRARQTVSEKLATIAEELPPSAKAPTLGPQSSILGEIMIIGLTVKEGGGTTLRELRTIADRVIRPRLLSVGGVSQVSVIGGEVKEYQIQLSTERMRHYGVTLGEALAAAEGVNDNAAGGVSYAHGNEYIIKGINNTTDMEAVGQAVVSVTEEGRTVTLGDIGNIREGSKTPRLGVASVRAQPAVLMTVTKQPKVGTIALTEKLEHELETLRPTLPGDVEIATDIFRQSTFISTSISNLQESLMEGALMVIIVLFFFLMNLRTTVISVIALPMSIIITVLILRAMDMSINTMSLGGIAIAIGSLVDDAIVDVENVYKRLRENWGRPEGERRGRLEVVYDASREVRTPIFNSTLIIVAGFLPLFFLSGMEGRMLIPLGVAFVVALGASTIVALTLTPVLCSYLLGRKGGKKSEGEERAEEMESREPWTAAKLKGWYSGALAWSLGHGKGVLWGAGALLVVAVVLSLTLGRGFLPAFNEGSMTINVSTLPGISLEQSDQVGRLAEEIILATPEVRTVARKTGRAELDEHSLGVNVSEIEAPYVLDKGRKRQEMVADLRQRLMQLPGVNIEIGQPISHRIDAMLSGTEAQIAVKVFGDDLNRLFAIGNQIKNLAIEIPGLADVNIEQQVERPELVIRPKREMLAKYGITPGALAEFIDVALGGRAVSQVYEDGLPYDLTVRLQDAAELTPENVGEMMIDSSRGKIPLGNVAEISSTTGPNTINRQDVSRRLVISANVEGRDLRGAVNALREAVEKDVKLPQGYYVSYGGQFESEAAASGTLLWASGLALLLIFVLLYAEFRNLGQCLIIMVNMPLAMIGGVIILVCTGSELNIPAIIGFISLLGIATRNGMLLLSRYNALSATLPAGEVIRRGSEDRLLPIVMTALTSALALIPLALRGTEPGNEIQSPLAMVIVGGLVSSTLLNLFVVPILYKIYTRTAK